MKSVSMMTMTAVLLVGSLLHAKPVQVTGAQAAELKKAVAIIKLRCGGNVSTSGVTSLIENATSVFLDDSGEQPALILYRDYQDEESGRNKLTVTTTPDFKSIAQLKIEVQSMQNANRGTLVRPRIVREFVTDATYICVGAN